MTSQHDQVNKVVGCGQAKWWADHPVHLCWSHFFSHPIDLTGDLRISRERKTGEMSQGEKGFIPLQSLPFLLHLSWGFTQCLLWCAKQGRTQFLLAWQTLGETLLGRKLFNFVNWTHPHFTLPRTLMRHLRWGYCISCCANVVSTLYPNFQEGLSPSYSRFGTETPHPVSFHYPGPWTIHMFVAVWWGGRWAGRAKESKGLSTKSLLILYHLTELHGLEYNPLTWREDGLTVIWNSLCVPKWWTASLLYEFYHFCLSWWG